MNGKRAGSPMMFPDDGLFREKKTKKKGWMKRAPLMVRSFDAPNKELMSTSPDPIT